MMDEPREIEIAHGLSIAECALIVVALEQVSDLIGDSRGVTGLHLNGDVAPWDELLGTWLDGFNDAFAPIKAISDERAARLEASKNDAFARLAKARGAS